MHTFARFFNFWLEGKSLNIVDWQRQAFPDELTDLLLELKEEVAFKDDEENEHEA